MFKNVGEARQYRVVVGLEGNHFGWEWDSAIGRMSSTATQKQRLYRDRYGYHDAIVKGERMKLPNLPASFNVLLKTLRGLALNVELVKRSAVEEE